MFKKGSEVKSGKFSQKVRNKRQRDGKQGGEREEIHKINAGIPERNNGGRGGCGDY